MRRPDGGTTSGKQIPTPPTVDDEYDASTLEVSEGLVRYYGWLLDRISDSISGRTLEVGAGIGTLSARVEPLCTDMVLVEPAANLCRHLEERFADVPNVTPCNGTLEQAVADYPDQFEPGFDTIVSFNVLEHIEDDVGTLRTAATLLRPGAHVVLFVPSLPFLYGAVDAEINHHRRYTKTTLSEAVRSAGLTLAAHRVLRHPRHRPVVHLQSRPTPHAVGQRDPQLRPIRRPGVPRLRPAGRPTARQEPYRCGAPPCAITPRRPMVSTRSRSPNPADDVSRGDPPRPTSRS